MMLSYIRVLYFLILAPVVIKAQTIPGLVAKYSFNNNNGKDEAGNNNARISEALPAEDRFGNPGFCYFLHGNYNSYINLGTSNILKPKEGSISVWVKVNLVTYNGKGVEINPILYTKSRASGDFNEGFDLGYNTRLKSIGCAMAVSELQQVSIHSPFPTLLGNWHHCVITYNATTFSYYLDGMLVGKVAKNFETSFLESDSLMIGNHRDEKNERFLCGCVDDVEIFNRVLSTEEVLELYDAPNPNRLKVVLGWIFISLVALSLVLFVIWIIRLYIKNIIKREKEQDRLKIQWYEQENKVLKAQMNPHFIFNSLNTIQQFIIVNDNKKAQLYLSKFSRLLRKILESNTSDKISLREEIDLCKKYLEIESLRFNNVFNYQIIIQENTNPDLVYIPHFLIQTFIENAIWHGLLPKEGNKNLVITFETFDDATLQCIIDDNGIGRQNAGKKTKGNDKKSLAINFIQQRLLMYSKLKGKAYEVKLVDKKNLKGQSEGTKVILTIPIIND